MTRVGGVPPMPWDGERVFTFPERDGWVFWTTGLEPAGWGEVAARVPGGENDDAVIAAVRAIDERAVADGQAWGAGIWFPESNGRRPTASVLVRTYPDRGDVAQAYRRFRKQVRRVPRIPGVTVSGYTVDSVETESGPMVVQVLDSTDDVTRVLLHTWRVTLFPVVADEVVEIECDTTYTHLVDAVEDELGQLVQDSVYAVAEGDA